MGLPKQKTHIFYLNSTIQRTVTIMKKTNISAITMVTFALILGGCATSSSTTNTNSADKEPATSVSATTEIKQSGAATPTYKDKQLVGYNFQKGFAVPAKIGNFFGFSYSATQHLTMTNGVTKAKVYKTLPVVIQVNHPEINGSTSSQWNDTLYFGRDNYAMWQFESDAELVTGKWTIAVKLNGEKIAEKNFFVQVPPKMPAKITQVCHAQIELFPKQLQQAHSQCCDGGDGAACYTFAWRGLEYIKDTKGAQLYYAKGCELGDISSCRTAAKMTTDEQQKLDFFNKACDLEDIESCIDAGREL